MRRSLSGGRHACRHCERREAFEASNTGWNSSPRSTGSPYYNDSKATNVDATLKALEAFPGPLIVILGGKDKGSPYTPLRELLA